MVIDPFDKLYRILGYTFQHPEHLKRALTHCSMGVENYERFEFLGDSILGFVIANELFHKFSLPTEGELSRMRSYLVKGETLATIGAEMGLGDFLLLGQGELRSGGFRRASILADALEAIFAAVFFDGGIEAAKQVIIKIYGSRLQSADLTNSIKDAKTLLQEYLQSQKLPLPKYKLTKISGDEHDQVFYISCTVQGITQEGQGEGQSRRKAEQLAAKYLLEKLQ